MDNIRQHPKWFYGSWLSLGKLFLVLHINNDAWDREEKDLFRFYVGWDSLKRKEGEALYTVFELKIAKHLKYYYNISGRGVLMFSFTFLSWFYNTGPTGTSYRMFRKEKY